jgi:hypothetical protein
MVPDITRLIARIEDWKGQGPALGRAEAARRLEEAHKLLEEVSNMLVEIRREMMGGGRGAMKRTRPRLIPSVSGSRCISTRSESTDCPCRRR